MDYMITLHYLEGILREQLTLQRMQSMISKIFSLMDSMQFYHLLEDLQMDF